LESLKTSSIAWMYVSLDAMINPIKNQLKFWSYIKSNHPFTI
jgi:hypothetical protein